MRSLASSAVTAFCLFGVVCAQETLGANAVLSCEKEGEWQVIQFGIPGPLGKLSVTSVPGTFKEGKGATELRYDRKPGQLQILTTQFEMAGFKTLEFDLWSEVATTIAVLVEDTKGARFNHAAQTQPGQWKRVVLTAADFKLNDDSPVKAAALDPALIKPSLSITDAAALFGASGPNVLRVDGVTAGREALAKLDVPTAIAGKTVTLTDNGSVATALKIGRGGTLKVTASRVAWSAPVSLEGGSLELDGVNLTLEGRFPHDVTWKASAGSTIRLAHCRVSSNFMAKLMLSQGARLEMNGVECVAAALTVDLQNGSTAQVEGAKGVGEFIVAPKVQARFAKCDNLMIWMAPAQGQIPVPDGKYVLLWAAPQESGLDLRISESSNVMWGFLSFPGSRIGFVDGVFRGAGLVFGGNSRETLAGVKNNAPMADFQMRLADRELKLANCQAKAWNCYLAGASDITLKDSLVGEVFVMANARLTMLNSTCDGTGGYMRIEGRTQVKLTKCGIACDLVVGEDARVTLEDCMVSGALHAMGRARIDLVRSEVQGETQKLDQAVITKK